MPIFLCFPSGSCMTRQIQAPQAPDPDARRGSRLPEGEPVKCSIDIESAFPLGGPRPPQVVGRCGTLDGGRACAQGSKARASSTRYFAFYSMMRLHHALGDRTLDQIYFGAFAATVTRAA